ncbi:MAG: ABC transporter ATP-binding protein [Treponema sp.]|jgi:ABC-type nitrate/sulfonate/bicarbonate transport system ATPase subunit|nr:ABC transporter ATP-binding protein [Treponema sp.]
MSEKNRRGTLITIRDLSRTYHDTNYTPVHALDAVNLDIEKGEFLSIIGPSGCGKTTLLRLLAGLDRAEEGSIQIEGKPILAPGPERGFIFQQAALYPWLTVEGNVGLGLKARGLFRARRQRVGDLIRMMGLAGFERSYPHEISGGMAQRAAIARALINAPEVLLLDEPLGALDAFKRIELQALLLEVWRETGATFVMVTHDVDEAIFLSERIVIMSARPGRIAKVVPVPLSASERDRGSERFLRLRTQILEELHLAAARPEPEWGL